MRFRKKPVEISAWQLTKENFAKGVPCIFRDEKIEYFSQNGGEVVGGEINTLEGVMTISENDWIIQGVNGEFYPCKPDIFEKTYDKVDIEYSNMPDPDRLKEITISIKKLPKLTSIWASPSKDEETK